MDHVLKHTPGVPGVYDIVTCIHCGASGRVAPQGVHFGVYLPSGNLSLPEECNGALREDVNPEFYPAYVYYTTIPLPQPGTKVHFQTGSTAWSSSPFKAQVYRATYNGTNWQWEVSRETFATDLKRRVLKLMDTDYQSCDRPAGITEEEDYFIL